MLYFIYFALFASQLLLSELVFVTLIISTLLLYDQIIHKKDDLFKIFLLILPSLSPLLINDVRLTVTVNIFIAIDPILIGSLFYLYRNCMNIKLRKITVPSLLYTILLIYAFIHLFILYLNGQESDQGLTYYFKAILYIIPIFTIYRNDLYNFKKQITKIVILSLVLIYAREILSVTITDMNRKIISGHLIFLAIGFPSLIIFYKFKLSNILLYLPSLPLIIYQSVTVIGIFLLSHFLSILRKMRIFFNKWILIFLINFQIIVLILILYSDFISQNYDQNNYILKKLLYDRMPIYFASIQSLEFFKFETVILSITTENILTNNIQHPTWSKGSHNYFLNMALNLGLIPASFLCLLLNLYIIRLLNNIKKNFYTKDTFTILFFITLISSFSVFSSTGNAYAEVTGFLFFLMLGSLNSVIRNNK